MPNNIWTIISCIISALTLIVSSTMFFAVKFNDLHHLQKDLVEVKKTCDHIMSKVVNLCERVSKIEGKLGK